jgi:hypothetical protein
MDLECRIVVYAAVRGRFGRLEFLVRSPWSRRAKVEGRSNLISGLKFGPRLADKNSW